MSVKLSDMGKEWQQLRQELKGRTKAKVLRTQYTVDTGSALFSEDATSEMLQSTRIAVLPCPLQYLSGPGVCGILGEQSRPSISQYTGSSTPLPGSALSSCRSCCHSFPMSDNFTDMRASTTHCTLRWVVPHTIPPLLLSESRSKAP